MELTCFTVEEADKVLVVTFDRPPVNAQNQRSREELVWLLDTVSDRDDVNAVVLTGRGRVFSAGADIKERTTIANVGGAYIRQNRLARDFFYAPVDCTKPVVCALNGAAIGAGYALAAGCDILVAADTAYVQMPEIDRGLMGGAKFLEQHLPRSVARMLFFTGRRMTAAQMLQHGLVVEVVPPDQLMECALQLAHEIAAKHGPTVQTAKATFNAAEAMSHRDGYRFEQTVTRQLADSEYTRAVQASFAHGVKATPSGTGIDERRFR